MVFYQLSGPSGSDLPAHGIAEVRMDANLPTWGLRVSEQEKLRLQEYSGNTIAAGFALPCTDVGIQTGLTLAIRLIGNTSNDTATNPNGGEISREDGSMQ